MNIHHVLQTCTIITSPVRGRHPVGVKGHILTLCESAESAGIFRGRTELSLLLTHCTNQRAAKLNSLELLNSWNR